MDRRSGNERREHPRHSVTIDIDWENATGRHSGTLSDISTSGCFVLSSGDTEDGETVRLFMPLGEGMKIQINGEVTNHVFEIGFAVRFVDLTPAQKDFLYNFVAMHKAQ
ncbi:MAG: PilZ domain-containing protein [Blastocatellia bacterium]